jgi:hypothetical protein
MNYPIPTTAEEIFALCARPIDEDLVVAAIAGVIKIARSQGQTLSQLTAEVLKEDAILDQVQRRWLNQVVTQAWHTLS